MFAFAAWLRRARIVFSLANQRVRCLALLRRNVTLLYFMRFLALLSLMALLCGCGLPGAPQPPSLGIPKAITDLQGSRKGATVTLAWTEPRETTDGELIKGSGQMVVGRAEQNAPFQKVAVVPLHPALRNGEPEQVSASDDISALLGSPVTSDFLLYHVESVTGRGRTSVPSNLVFVPAVLTAPAPHGLTLGLVPDGVTIRFNLPPLPVSTRLNAEYIFRIERRQAGGSASVEPVIVGQVRPAEQVLPLIDSRIEWEKTYEYWVTPVTLWRAGPQQGEVEGEDSPHVTIAAHDTFPPAAPRGLEAVFSGVVQKPAIDLTWMPSTEEDLAGYNVYRRGPTGAAVKVNTQLLKTPAFQDNTVAPGQTYAYSVTAVDLRGNESARSQEASEAVPRQEN
jgi:hypothetical protein